MAYPAAKARLLVHARTAAAAVTPAIEDAQIAFPLPQGDCVRLWYGGEADPSRFERYTVSSEMVGKITNIGLFLAVPTLDTEMAAHIDTRGEAFGHALRTAINGDSNLNGECDSTVLVDGTPEYITFGNARLVRYLWQAISDYVEYPLAP